MKGFIGRLLKRRKVDEWGMICKVSILLLLGISIAFTQPSKYTSRTGHVHIKSSNRFMDVVADNYQVYCELRPQDGKVVFTGLMKSFEFKLGALDRAFNSDRVNLDQYTKFNFDGVLTNYKEIDFSKAGEYPAVVKGTLKLGGYKRITEARGTIVVENSGQLNANADFSIRIEEESMETINDLMKKKLPSVVSLDTDKLGISRDIELQLSATYRPR